MLSRVSRVLRNSVVREGLNHRIQGHVVGKVFNQRRGLIVSPTEKVKERMKKEKVVPQRAYPIIWFDLETTGLRTLSDDILEVCAVITDAAGEILIDEPFHMVVSRSSEELEKMNQWCRTNHKHSGLIDDVLASETDIAAVDNALVAYVNKHLAASAERVIGGNNIWFDRAFAARQLPLFTGELSRPFVIDVSSLEAVLKRLGLEIELGQPEKKRKHRAVDDVLETINQYKYYRNTVLMNALAPKEDKSRPI